MIHLLLAWALLSPIVGVLVGRAIAGRRETLAEQIAPHVFALDTSAVAGGRQGGDADVLPSAGVAPTPGWAAPSRARWPQ
ncbi:MAG TPA: hypothetical protein VFJ85_03030 [Acidimicrobiales bacterium]|nr:hypothetical protein [Acidimicrobiales bacterium]